MRIWHCHGTQITDNPTLDTTGPASDNTRRSRGECVQFRTDVFSSGGGSARDFSVRGTFERARTEKCAISELIIDTASP